MGYFMQEDTYIRDLPDIQKDAVFLQLRLKGFGAEVAQNIIDLSDQPLQILARFHGLSSEMHRQTGKWAGEIDRIYMNKDKPISKLSPAEKDAAFVLLRFKGYSPEAARNIVNDSINSLSRWLEQDQEAVEWENECEERWAKGLRDAL